MTNAMNEITQNIEKISNEVNEAILNRNYKLIKRNKYDCIIEIDNERFSIWMSNKPEDTKLYTILKYRIYLSEFNIGFKKPATCRKILQEKTDEEKETERQKACEEIKRLQKIVNCEDEK